MTVIVSWSPDSLREQLADWAPVVGFYFALVTLAAQVIVGLVTWQVEPALLSASGTIAALSEGASALRELRKGPSR